MNEFTVAAVMIRAPVTVSPATVFKDVVCALLASDLGAVAVIDDDARPLGTVSENDVLANLEFHGGIDPPPLIRAARKRWRRATAETAADVMTGPAAIVYATQPISQAARLLALATQPALCVIDGDRRLVGLVTSRALLTVYQRSDQSIVADITDALAAYVQRPARNQADITIAVNHGVVVLNGTLVFRSRVENAGYAASRVPGVVAVHNNLAYEIDDMTTTGF